MKLRNDDIYSAIRVLDRVAAQHSFSETGRQLGVSASAISQTISQLERRLRSQLLNRSTRHVHLTEAGRQLLERTRPYLQRLDEELELLVSNSDTPAGTLRLNVSRVAIQMLITPYLPAFFQRYPDVRLEFNCENRLINLSDGYFDAGIRLEESLDPTVIARRLGARQTMTAYAAPAYLAAHGEPRTPYELAAHRCVNFRTSTGAIYRWEFQDQGTPIEIQTPEFVTANDTVVLKDIVLQGQGIGYAFTREIAPEVASGALVPILRDWAPTFNGFHIYYLKREFLPRKLAVFIEFFSDKLNRPASD